jgi:hypothetical protein
MHHLPTLRLNPNAALRREQITDSDFCIVVDDFLLNPDVLVDYASTHRAAFGHPNVGYPGVQIRLHDDAMREIFRFVRTKMSKEYGFLRGKIGIRSLLSLLTTKREQLQPLQRICHIDPNQDPTRGKFAALVYLFEDERLGGTSFFRWRDQQLVWQAVALVRKDPQAGEEFLKQHFVTFREPPRYMTESNEIAELIHTVPARFNRFVFYSGDVPHTGAITAPEILSEDPRSGRLTLNLFFSVLPA